MRPDTPTPSGSHGPGQLTALSGSACRSARFRPRLVAMAVGLAIAGSPALAQPAQDDAVALPRMQVEGVAESKAGIVALDQPAAVGKLAGVPLHDSPVSVSVVEREFIEDTGAKNIQEALLYSAGVYAGQWGFDTRLDGAAVRGLNASRYIDGLRSVYGFYNSPRTEIFTLERVEVLKGPSSTLYGQSDLGGIINVVSKLPQAERQGEIWAQAGSFDRAQLGVDLTGAVTDDGTWLYRMIALKRDSGTQVDHVADDALVLAPSLTWRPTDSTTFTLLVNHQENDGQVSAQFLPTRGTLEYGPLGWVDTDTFVGEPGWDRYDTEATSFTAFFEQALSDAWSLSATVRHTETESETREHWAAIPFPPDAAGNVNRTIHMADRSTDVLNFDMRLQGSFELGITQHTLAIGVDRQDAEWNEWNYGNGNGGVINLYNPVYGNLNRGAVTPVDRPDSALEQTGIYLIDHIEIGPWVISAALRRDDAENRTLNLGTTPDTVSEDEETTGRLGLMYRFENGLSPYVSYAESFVPNLGNDGFGRSLAPTTGEQTEAGVKYLSAAGDLSVVLAWFDIEERNRVVSGDQPGGYDQTGATVEGWELELRKRWERFELLANFTDLDAVNASTGHRLAAIAEQTASVWGKYEFGNGLRVGAGARYVGDRVGSGGGPEITSVTLLDAMVGFTLGHWDLSLDAKNLTDDTWVSWCRYEGADCGFGERRNVTANVRYRF